LYTIELEYKKSDIEIHKKLLISVHLSKLAFYIHLIYIRILKSFDLHQHKKIINMKKIAVVIMLGMLVFSTSCKKKKVEQTPTPEIPIHSYTSTVSLAYANTQTDPACFIDLDNGAVYTVSQALAHQSEIDIVYVLRYSSANDPMFISIGNFDGGVGYPISYWDKTTLGIDSFTTFNHTLLSDANSSNTATGFDAITTVSGFSSWLGSSFASSDFNNVDPAMIGNVKLFRTHQNKRGALKILNCQNGSSGFATIEIKVEP
jgi:hypothetical protein